MKINTEWLSKVGFMPFAEDGELQFYFIHPPRNKGTISLAPPNELMQHFNVDNWHLRMKVFGNKEDTFGHVDLSCMCDSVERFEEILSFFNISITNQ